MARPVRKPENFAGMHFFNPVDRMQLVEVIRGEKTSDETTATLVALAKRVGKTAIVVKDCPGFLVNRILFPYLNEAMVLLEEGAEPRALDKAATAMRAKLEQNPKVRETLLATGNLTLRPDHMGEPGEPPEWRYYQIWMEIRRELQ